MDMLLRAKEERRRKSGQARFSGSAAARLLCDPSARIKSKDDALSVPDPA
jgi:hypothetical protein